MEGARRGAGHGMSKVKVISCQKSWERTGHGWSKVKVIRSQKSWERAGHG